MYSFAGKLKDHYSIFKSSFNYKFNKIGNNKIRSLNIDYIIYNAINKGKVVPIEYLKINENKFTEVPVKFGSKLSKVLLYKTNYGYFIKPYEKVARCEFEVLFQEPNNIKLDKNKTIFIPYTD